VEKTKRDIGNIVYHSGTIYSSTQPGCHARGEERFKQLQVCLTLALELLESMFSASANEEKKELENLVHDIRDILGLSNRFKENHQVENESRKEGMDKVHQEEKRKMEKEKGKKLKRAPEFFNELNQAMEENFSDPDFNVERLAKKLDISESTLYRKIRSLNGQTPCEFINSYRLEKAVHKLKKPLALVTDVAYEVGFNSRTYFTKCFKDTFRLSPSVFKAKE
jgi:AraC-like DNA-binding protein